MNIRVVILERADAALALVVGRNAFRRLMERAVKKRPQ